MEYETSDFGAIASAAFSVAAAAGFWTDLSTGFLSSAKLSGEGLAVESAFFPDDFGSGISRVGVLAVTSNGLSFAASSLAASESPGFGLPNGLVAGSAVAARVASATPRFGADLSLPAAAVALVSAAAALSAGLSPELSPAGG